MPTESHLTRSASHTSTQTGTRTRTVFQTRRDGRLVGVVVTSLQLWRAVRRAVARAWAVTVATITPVGALVIGFASLGLWLGLAHGWVEWLVAGVTALVLVLLAVPFLLGRAAYDVDLAVTDQRVVAGSEVRGGIRVVNSGRRVALPGRLDVPVGKGLVELALPLLRPGREFSQDLLVPAQRRGIVMVGPVTAVRGDPVGMFRRESAWDDVHELFVHPRTVSVPSTGVGLVRDLEGAPTSQLVDADVSFHAIREYAPGDSRRQIHWKSTAKTGTLMVRQYEESRRSRMAIVLSCARAEYRDDDEFELAVSAAASLGVQAIRDGRDLEVVASVEIPELIRSRVRSIRTLKAATPRILLDECCGIELADSTMPFAEVSRLAAESGDQVSLAVLVCGSTPGLRELRQAALAFPADSAVIAIVCDERAHPSMRRFGPLTVLTIGLLEDLTQLLLRGVQS